MDDDGMGEGGGGVMCVGGRNQEGTVKLVNKDSIGSRELPT